jgi:spore photoproduct lyase
MNSSEKFDFESIYIHPESLESEVVKRFLDIFPKEKFILSENPEQNLKPNSGPLSSQQFDKSKKNIFITRFKGQFFKRCPGTHQKMACCNYFVLNLGLQCNMNCSYCYLQSFINSPLMTIYSNIDEALQELDTMTKEFSGLSFRVGTGEVIDSLSLDPLTLYSRKLINFFKSRPHLTLEFKTKSNYVDQFLDIASPGNVVVSWSINPQYIIQSEEHGTASLKKRLEAAKKCLFKGYKIGFHLDPVIWHPEWKQNYFSLVQDITSVFKPEDVPYISLGALRFQTEQRWIMKQRFPLNSLVNTAEMFEGKDKKLRYDQELRNEMFEFIIKTFKNYSTDWNVFLCMESPETWLSTYESMPRKIQGLESLFDPRKSI